jgi:WD40 repeat protein
MYGGRFGVGSVIAVSPDGRTLAVAEGNLVILRDLTRGRFEALQPAAGHTSDILGLSFGAHGNLCATLALDRSLRLWDLDRVQPREHLSVATGWFGSPAIALSADATRLALGGMGPKGLLLWRVSATGLRLLAEDEMRAGCLAFSPDSSALFVGGTTIDGIHVLDTAGPSMVRTELGAHRGTQALAFSPDGMMLAARFEHAVQLWRRRGKDWVRAGMLQGLPRCRGYGWPVSLMAFSHTGTKLIVGSTDLEHREVCTYDLSGDTPKKTATAEGHHQPLTALATSPQADVIATADRAGLVRVWAPVTGKIFYQWSFPGPVRQLAFAPDGYHLAQGNASGTVYILRLAKLRRP